MRNYISKFKTREKSPKRSSVHFSLYSAIGGAIAIASVALLTHFTKSPFLMAPFGATCVLAFGVPNSPLAQPRNIIGGHMISTLVGFLCFYLFENEWYSLAIGVGLSIAIMQLTATTHPPAGADPIVVILGAENFSFVLNPVLSGAIVITIIAVVFNNLHKDRKYPIYWK